MPKTNRKTNESIIEVVPKDIALDAGLKMAKEIREEGAKEIESLKAEHVAFIKSLKEEYDTLLAMAGTYNPHKNPKAMSIIQQPDGNWIGSWQKFGKVIEIRGIGPETVVQLLLTSDQSNV